MGALDYALKLLNNLVSDSLISKSIKTVLEEIIEDLKDNKNLEIKISAALQKIEDLASDPNLSTDIRTQMWSLTTLLENALKEL
ncbi:MAG: UPF0147 family protein [Candidatus Nanoarchaeia archaeon]